MNSAMTITIQVRHAQAVAATKQVAQQMGVLQRALARVQGAMRSAMRGGMQNYFEGLAKAGNQLQWTGRQIEYRFTLPLIAAGFVASKFALENERAFTRLEKVYGQFVDQGQNVNKELRQLRRGYEELSNAFGVAQSEVINIGADFAQAGAEGVNNFHLTRMALEAMIIGEMEAGEAGTALISVMAQYGLQVDDGVTGTMDLREALAALNKVENTTAINFKDLLAVLERSAGSARTAGVGIRELTALSAALVPATGSAERAGNGLRTLFSRLLAPTKDAAELIKIMGINWEEFNNSTGTERLHMMARGFEDMSAGQQALVSSTVASRYQINRFDVLMRDILNPLGMYQTAMRATADATGNLTDYQRELMTYLRSSPQAFQIVKTQLQNSMARIIVPLLPAILGLAKRLAALVDAFTKLSPETQQFIMFAAIAVAVLGPLMAYMGTLMGLVGQLGRGFIWLTFGLNGNKGALRKLTNAFQWLGKNLWDITKIITKPLRQALSNLRTWFQESGRAAMAHLWTALKRVAAQMWATAKTGAVALWDALRRLGTQMWAFAQRSVAAAMTGLRHLAVALWTMARGAAVAAYTAMLNLARVIHIRLTTMVLPALAGALSRTATALWAFATRAVLAASTSILNFARAIHIRLTTTVLPALAGALSRTAEALWTFASRAVLVAWTAVLNFARMIHIQLTTTVLPALAGALGRAGAALWLFATRAYTVAAGALVALAGSMLNVARMAHIALITRALPMLAGALSTMGNAALVAWAKVAAPIVIGAAIVAAILGLVYLVWHFRDEIGEALGGVWEGIIRAWNAAPAAIGRFFVGLARMVASAVQAIAEMLSHLNPFARHSPSLVEQVSRGVEVIASKYASLAGIGAHFRGAIVALQQWNAASAEARRILEAQDRAEARASIMAFDPSAGPAFDQMVAGIDQLKVALDAVGREFAAQEFVVADYADALDLAERHLEALQEAADATRTELDRLGAELDIAQTALDRFADAPLVGMRAMGDAIFENEMAQKALRLELLRLEEAGHSIEDIEGRLAALNGELEMLRGEREGLRLAGAGSDVLGPLDEQISLIEQMRRDLTTTVAPINELQKQLEDLARTGEILDLEQSLAFDPLTRQIEQLIDTSEELTFAEAIAGVQRWQPEVERLTEAYEAQEAVLQQQELAVAVAQRAHDQAKASYDREKAALDLLGEAYDAIASQIRDMEGSLNDFASAAQRATDNLSNMQSAWADAGDFEVPGGEFGIPYDQGDIDAAIDEMMREMETSFAAVDMWAPLKEQFARLEGWLKENWGGSWSEVWENWKTGWSIYFEGLGGIFTRWWERISTWFNDRWQDYHRGWDRITSGISSTVSGWWNGFIESWKTGWRKITGWFSDRWEDFKLGWSGMLDGVKSTLTGWWDDIKIRWEGFWNGLSNFLGDWPDKIRDKVRDGINLGIKAINRLIDGVNSVAKTLKIGWEIDPIPEYARGGALPAAGVGSGFITNGPRAIVGEGSPVHPEYVIPTDPRYRGRAGMLYANLGRDLGLFAEGGVLPQLFGMVEGREARLVDQMLARSTGGPLDWLREKAATVVFAPFLKLADFMIDRLPDEWMRKMANAVKNGVYNWVKGKDRDQEAAGVPSGPVGTGQLSGRGFRALIDHLQRSGVEHYVTSTFRAGGRSLHGQGRAADFSLPGHGNRGYGHAGLRAIFEAFQPVAGNLAELILAGAPFNIKNGRRVDGYAWGTRSSPGNHWNHVHAALAMGGIIPQLASFDAGGWLRPGLTLAYNGTGRSEAVTTASGEGPGRELHFHGDLSFPNIRSGDDAEAFIRNLESLVV